MIKVNNSNKNVVFGDLCVYMKCDILVVIVRRLLVYLIMFFFVNWYVSLYLLN